jgi:predicted transcriptional regulator
MKNNQIISNPIQNLNVDLNTLNQLNNLFESEPPPKNAFTIRNLMQKYNKSKSSCLRSIRKLIKNGKIQKKRYAELNDKGQTILTYYYFFTK